MQVLMWMLFTVWTNQEKHYVASISTRLCSLHATHPCASLALQRNPSCQSCGRRSVYLQAHAQTRLLVRTMTQKLCNLPLSRWAWLFHIGIGCLLLPWWQSMEVSLVMLSFCVCVCVCFLCAHFRTCPHSEEKGGGAVSSYVMTDDKILTLTVGTGDSCGSCIYSLYVRGVYVFLCVWERIHSIWEYFFEYTYACVLFLFTCLVTASLSLSVSLCPPHRELMRRRWWTAGAHAPCSTPTLRRKSSKVKPISDVYDSGITDSRAW